MDRRGHIIILRNTFDEHLFHVNDLLDYRSGLPRQAGKHLKIHVIFFCHLHAAGMKHLSSQAGQLQHLIEGNDIQLPGVGNDAGVGSIDTVHIGIDLAEIRVEHRRPTLPRWYPSHPVPEW